MHGPINNNISNVYASNKFHQNSFTGYGQAVSEDNLIHIPRSFYAVS